MYYNLICDRTEEATQLVTQVLLDLYDKYKDNEEIFPKDIDETNEK
ncbi:hypothetical protein [Clostridium tertium]|nr:hypothetical protein [Clostridium tertium]MDI9215981.1 hypothetical protein [Clostridium tertium]